MTTPISILIPVRNTGRWLGQTIASVQRQTFADWKLLAIDDGSTDDSAALLKHLAAKDARIQFRARENRGLVATRNELLQWADTEWIAWLDSDDLMTPQRLRLQLERFASDPALLLLGGAATLVDPDGLPIKTHGFPEDHEALTAAMREEIAFYFPSLTMRRQAALDAGGFRQPFAIAEDYDMCLRLSEIGRVGNLPEVLVLYRQHMESTANAGRGKTLAYSRLVRALAAERQATGADRLQRGEPVILDFAAMPSARQNIAETHRRWGWWALQAQNHKTARKYAWRALRRQPWSRESWRLAACTIRGY